MRRGSGTLTTVLVGLGAASAAFVAGCLTPFDPRSRDNGGGDASVTGAADGSIPSEAGSPGASDATTGPSRDGSSDAHVAAGDASADAGASDSGLSDGAAGEAGCAAGLVECSGACTSLASIHSCGACGTDCTSLPHVNVATVACVSDRCVYTCGPNYSDCADSGAGCGTSLAASPNCGACGATCATNTACSATAGVYSCQSTCGGQTPTLCNGLCVDEQSDNANCGGCSAPCATGKTCVSGACKVQITATGASLSPTQGVTFSGSVATFTDVLTTDAASAFTAVVDWGDGTTSAGTVTGGSGAFTVTGSHKYTVSGGVTVKVTVTDPATQASQTTTQAVTVSPQITVIGGRVTATAGLPVTGQFAVVSDAVAGDTNSALTATITWGDGSTSYGTIAGQAGAFTVSSSHTYASVGSLTMTIQVANSTSGSSGSTTMTVSVRPAPVFHEYPLLTSSCYPQDITAGPDGNLWFTEFNCNQYARCTTSGAVTEWLAGSSSGPYGITSGTGSTVWYTDEVGGGIATTQGASYSLAASSEPHEIVGGEDGNFWFTDYYHAQVDRITPSGTVTPFTIPTAYSGPEGIAAGPDGRLWFTERGNDSMGAQFSKIGAVTTAGAFTEYTLPGTFSPQYIAAGPDGALWFNAFNQSAVGRITTTGVFTQFTALFVNEVTSGPDGNLWFTDYNDNMIVRMTPTGAYTAFAIPTASCTPMGISTGPDGNIWFVEQIGNKVGSITP